MPLPAAQHWRRCRVVSRPVQAEPFARLTLSPGAKRCDIDAGQDRVIISAGYAVGLHQRLAQRFTSRDYVLRCLGVETSVSWRCSEWPQRCGGCAPAAAQRHKARRRPAPTARCRSSCACSASIGFCPSQRRDAEDAGQLLAADRQRDDGYAALRRFLEDAGFRRAEQRHFVINVRSSRATLRECGFLTAPTAGGFGGRSSSGGLGKLQAVELGRYLPWPAIPRECLIRPTGRATARRYSRHFDGGQTVSDDQRGAVLHEVLQCAWTRRSGFVVERRSGLVENQDRGILENGPGDRQTLALSSPTGGCHSPMTVSKPSGWQE